MYSIQSSPISLQIPAVCFTSESCSQFGSFNVFNQLSLYGVEYRRPPKLVSSLFSIDDAQLQANKQTSCAGRGGSCALIGWFLPLQAVWQVSRTTHSKRTQQQVSSFMSPSSSSAPGCSTR